MLHAIISSLATVALLSSCSESFEPHDLPCAITGDCPSSSQTDTTQPAGTEDFATPATGSLAADSTRPHTETEDTAPTDTASPDSECLGVTFVPSSGPSVDYTTEFTYGVNVTLREDGRLSFCPGEWWVMLVIEEAEVAIRGEGEVPSDTVLSGGESGSVLSLDGPGIVVDIENLTIDRGVALGTGNLSSGGGLRCKGDVLIRITDTIFSNNKAYDGAAIFANDGCVLEVSDTKFVNNHGDDDGGAVRLQVDSRASFSNVGFFSNSGRDGGAISVYESDVSIEGSVFSNNSATAFGGALMVHYGSAEIETSQFSDSRAYYGGAITNYGELSLTQVQFTNSNASGKGGAVLHYVLNHTSLAGDSCDFADSHPEDLDTYLHGSYTLGTNASFECDQFGCEVH